MQIARFLLFVLLALVWATAARADDAESLLKEGVELRRVGKELEALEKFKQAHALSPSPRALGQIGLASKSLRLYVDAERALLAALAAKDDPWVRQNREPLELARDVVAKQLATVVVRSNVADAELSVNGAKLPLSQPVRVLAGLARIELHAANHRPAQAEHNLPAGQTTELTIDLEREAEAPKPPPPAATTPPPIEVPPPPDRKPSPAGRIATYTAAGIGIVGLGVGTFFGVQTFTAKRERDALCPDVSCNSEDGLRFDSDARSAATISTVGFVVGLAALATAGVLFLTLR